jgi:serine/threonine protein kinase
MTQDYTTGQRLGDYEILGVLGAGGMGKVYKVRNVISDRVEAMKILLPNLASEKELADRFLREIKLLATLHHPNIAALRTALTLDNQLVMIMEYVEGTSLSSRLHQGPIAPGDAVKYVDQVLAALSYAHKLGIVHRDIKPANMMLTPDGTVKLMDFGIARSGSDRSLTTTGTTLGSLNYMPPEQVKGESTDARSDIYSLGVSMYEMVTGILPFEAASNYSLMAAHIEQIPKAPIIHKPGMPESLNLIILMAMAKEPEKRFQTADAFRAALSTVDAPVSAPAGTTMPSAWSQPYAGGGSDETLAVNTPAPESVRAAAARASVAGTAAAAGVAGTAAAASAAGTGGAAQRHQCQVFRRWRLGLRWLQPAVNADCGWGWAR